MEGSCSGGVLSESGATSIAYGGEGRMSVRTRCRFSCSDHERFKMVGSRIARCTKNSEWKLKGGPPKCIERHSYKKRMRKEQRRKKQRDKKRKKLLLKNRNRHRNRKGGAKQRVNAVTTPVSKQCYLSNL